MKALIIVDAQYDFMPGGALPVTEGDLIVPIINNISKLYDVIVATKDWHPVGHCSFGEQGGIWPNHCIQGTKGAELHKDLIKPDFIIEKGLDIDIDSYSGFFDNERKKATGLGKLLSKTIEEVAIVGLALDYCVKYTALDAVSLGYNTYLILEACRAVNIKPEDGDRAIEEMKEAGIIIK